MPKVYFVGCGPGDPDLITVKAKKLIQKADVVVYSGSLIPSEILKMCKKAKKYDAAKLVREEIFDLLKKNAKKGKKVVRLHDGDPSIYGAIREQMDNLQKEKIDSVIIPGVTSFLASAAALGAQLTLPGITQTMIISRAEKRTKVPKREKISELAKHRSTMIFYLSVHLLSNIVVYMIRALVMDLEKQNLAQNANTFLNPKPYKMLLELFWIRRCKNFHCVCSRLFSSNNFFNFLSYFLCRINKCNIWKLLF